MFPKLSLRKAGCLAAATLLAAACGTAGAGTPTFPAYSDVAPNTKARAIEAPYYGDALFHFFQDRYFTSITTLMASQHFQRIAPHDDEAEVLRGGMLLSYGLHKEAGEIFARLIDKGAAPPVRDRAWFYLAKIRYQRGFLAEADDAHREQVRDRLDEPYRTMLGHLRHESGHYFEWILVDGTDRQERCRELFGDDTVSYQDAIDRHYEQGPPADWAASYISTYATMHPYEDFAETWAHYLHICDTVESAVATGLIVTPTDDVRTPFSRLVTTVWSPLSLSLNLINRSMGDDDLYPFVIPAPVLDKLDFVASLRPA